MRGFFSRTNFIVLLVFIGIPALGTASVAANESLDNPPAGWNSILPGLGHDQLRRATENILNFADRFPPNGPANAEKVGGGLSGPPTRGGRGTEGLIPDKHSRPPSHPEDDLARFVGQMMAAECVPIWPMQFYGAVTYSPFTFQSLFRFRGRIGRIR